jgi:uncharacterized lipoprotein
MLLRTIRYTFIIALITNLSGCSYLFGKHSFVTQRETEYLRSNATPPLQLPPGASAANMGNDYVIPPTTSQASTQPNLLPPDSLTAKVASGEISPAALKKIQQTLAQSIAQNRTAPTNKNVQPNNPVLLLAQPTAQLWKKIGDSLNRASYTVVNQNQTMGLYYFLDTIPAYGKVTTNTPIYQLHVRSLDGGTETYVTDTNGKVIDLDTAKRILADLQDALNGKVKSPLERQMMRFLNDLF